MPSPAAWQPEVPCVRCGNHVTGIGWGELCPACRSKVVARARSLSSRIALGTTVLAALYIWWRMPMDFPLARVYAGITVLATYLIVRRIATVVATEYLKRPNP